LLEIEEDAAGAIVRDTVFDQGTDDLVESGEDVAVRSHDRKTRAEYVGVANSSMDALLASVIAVVVIAELFAEQGGGSARSAVRLGEIADAVRQWKPPMRPAIFQPAAKIVQGCRESGSKVRHASAEGRRPTNKRGRETKGMQVTKVRSPCTLVTGVVVW
jgi:hypothetical protein